AFSQDGRFLVSAAADRTVCVWSLIDLDGILQKRGALPGLVVTRTGDDYVVAKILRESPYEHRDDLAVGDVIEGYLEGAGRLQALSWPLAIHHVGAARSPGQSMPLRLRRAGQGVRDVSLTLGQATDERKPLLTLFLERDGPGRPLEWLAWNPLGPYDSSGP